MISDPAASGETTVVEETGVGKYQVEARVGSSTVLVDEPVSVGGLGSGPNPYDLLNSALGSCTAMTIRLYANHKGWPLDRVRVSVSHQRGGLEGRDVFNREISLEGDLNDEQRARLLEIAGRCPVHVTLDRGADVRTRLLPVELALGEETQTMGLHLEHMHEAGQP